MTQRLALKIGQVSAVCETNERLVQHHEGDYATVDYQVYLTAPADGSRRELVHGHTFRQREDAARLAAQVAERGDIDPAHWFEAAERESLEDRFDRYAEEDALEGGR